MQKQTSLKPVFESRRCHIIIIIIIMCILYAILFAELTTYGRTLPQSAVEPVTIG